MVKVSFNSSPGQKDSKKEEENSEVLIPESTELQNGVRRLSRVSCWCTCLGLAILLTGVVVGGACLYSNFVHKKRLGHFCLMRYYEEDFMVSEDDYMELPPQMRTIQETIEVVHGEEVALIDVLVPKFSKNDPAKIVHDFSMNLTLYLDLRLDICYIITLNTSAVMTPMNLRELVQKIKNGKYLPQSYLIHEKMMATEQVDNVHQLGRFIYNLCRGKDTYRLQRRDAIPGKQKREALTCSKILHFENSFAVKTEICHPVIMVPVSDACSPKHVILLLLLNILFLLGC